MGNICCSNQSTERGTLEPKKREILSSRDDGIVDEAKTQATEENTTSSQEEEKQVSEVKPGQDLTKLYVDLEEGTPSDEIPSLCMECKQEGMTRFMYTKIPMFKEIILSSFTCEHCGFKNTEV